MGTKITASVHLTVNTLPDLLKALSALESREVMVGWPSDKNKPREDGDPMPNYAIAYILDKGSGANNLPPQPALGPGIQEGREKIQLRLRDAGSAALHGSTSGVEKNFIAAGLEGVSAVRRKMLAGPWEPLKKSTIAARRRRGRQGIKRYLDTGQLAAAVNFSVRKRKG